MPSRNALLAVVGLVLATVIGCASDEEKVAQHVTAAEQYQEEGDLRSALVELKSALSLQPKNADLNEKLATIYRGLDKPARAAFYFGEAYRLDPSKTDAALEQAPAFYGSDPAAARALIDEVLERDPQKALAHVRLAELLLLESKTDEALASALTATELEPSNVAGHRMVGAVHRSRIRATSLAGGTTPDSVYEAAIEVYRRSEKLASDREQQGAWYDRLQQAVTYQDWGNHEEEAKQAFRDAFELAKEKDDRPGLQSVTEESRRLAFLVQDPEFTRWSLERWVEVSPNAVVAWRQLADLERSEGRSGDDIWQRALEGRPDDVMIHAGYARHLAEQSRVDDAIAHLEGLPSEVASLPDVGALQVETLISAGDLKQAQERLLVLERESPDAPITRLTRAKFDLQINRVESALTNLRELSGEVERADVLRQLSLAEARAGNIDAAIAAADRAIELRPATSITPHTVRMRMLSRKRDWNGVLRSFREVRRLGLRPGSQVHVLRIQALYESGRDGLGRQFLVRALDTETPGPDLALLYNNYEGTKDPEGNRRYLAAASEHNPDDFRLVQALVLDEMRAGKDDAGLARIGAFDKRAGKDTMPGMRAQIHWRQGRKDEAEAAARVAFHAVPRPQRATRLLVTILTERGKVDEAIELLEATHGKGKLGADGMWQLGRMHLDQRSMELSHQRLEEAHRSAPHVLAIQNDLAWVLAETGRELERAIELARAVRSGHPEDAGVADTLGYVYLKKGLFEPALFEFRSAIELARVRGSEVADYHYHLGLALQAMGRADEAQSAFVEALRIEPKHEDALRAQANVATGADAS